MKYKGPISCWLYFNDSSGIKLEENLNPGIPGAGHDDQNDSIPTILSISILDEHGTMSRLSLALW